MTKRLLVGLSVGYFWFLGAIGLFQLTHPEPTAKPTPVLLLLGDTTSVVDTPDGYEVIDRRMEGATSTNIVHMIEAGWVPTDAAEVWIMVGAFDDFDDNKTAYNVDLIQRAFAQGTRFTFINTRYVG